MRRAALMLSVAAVALTLSSCSDGEREVAPLMLNYGEVFDDFSGVDDLPAGLADATNAHVMGGPFGYPRDRLPTWQDRPYWFVGVATLKPGEFASAVGPNAVRSFSPHVIEDLQEYVAPCRWVASAALDAAMSNDTWDVMAVACPANGTVVVSASTWPGQLYPWGAPSS